jgi:hypothetical protein
MLLQHKNSSTGFDMRNSSSQNTPVDIYHYEKDTLERICADGNP